MTFKALSTYTRNQALAAGPSLLLGFKDIVEIYENEVADSPEFLSRMADVDVTLSVVEEVRWYLKKWCRKNIKGDHEFSALSPEGIEVKFVRQRDAVMFKLTWGGK